METRKVRLEYPLDRVATPVFSRLASNFDVQPNVLAAEISPIKGGWMLMSLTGSTQAIESALEWVRNSGITVTIAA